MYQKTGFEIPSGDSHRGECACIPAECYGDCRRNYESSGLFCMPGMGRGRCVFPEQGKGNILRQQRHRRKRNG